MRIKFETVDKNGKLHKRGSVSRVYSHCVVVHFAAHPPSKFWPKGVAAYSRAEWAGSRVLAERKASRWRKEAHVLEVEVLDARRRCDAVPQGQVARAGQLILIILALVIPSLVGTRTSFGLSKCEVAHTSPQMRSSD